MIRKGAEKGMIPNCELGSHWVGVGVELKRLHVRY